MTMMSQSVLRNDGTKDNNVNKKEQGSNVSGTGDHDPWSSYSSKARSDDEEYSSEDDERGNRKYQDPLDSSTV